MKRRMGKEELAPKDVEVPFEAYVTAASEIATLHFHPDEPVRILLVTESPDVVESTAKYPNIKWYFTQNHNPRRYQFF